METGGKNGYDVLVNTEGGGGANDGELDDVTIEGAEENTGLIEPR